MTRVAIVNDLALAVETLKRAVAKVPNHHVVWVARDGLEALEKIAEDAPDLVLMDLVMPGMNGVETTRQIMQRWPCPILVVTATRVGNFEMVFQAMSAGALDAVDTPKLEANGQLSGFDEFVAKLLRVEGMSKRPLRPPSGVTRQVQPSDRELAPLVLIGASTGGPRAVADILGPLVRTPRASVVIVQHVDAHFAPGLASWLASESGFPVRVARDGDEPTPGIALIASTNDHLTMTSRRSLRYTREPVDYPYRPSVDVLFRSVAAMWPAAGCAALLTGMGQDGARGLLALKEAGWTTIAQDEASSVVWGMPKAAVELGAATQVLSLGDIGPMLARRVALQRGT